jgi:hypothetical protein
MEQQFNHTVKYLQALQSAIEASRAQNPEAKIRDVEGALKDLTAVYVTSRSRAADEPRNAGLPGENFIVGICCGDGSERFEIEAGISREHGEKIAREIIRHNTDLEVLSSKAPQPFIAVNPERMGRVSDSGSRLILDIAGGGHSFTVLHTDAHRAYIDSFLLDNKLLQMRGQRAALQERDVHEKTGPSVRITPF